MPDGFVTPVASSKKTKHLSVQRPRAKAVSTSNRMKKTRSRKFHQPSRTMPQLRRSLASLGRMLDRRVNESDKSYTNRLLLACEVEDQRQGELFDQRLKSNNDLKVEVRREDLVPYQGSSKFMTWTLINKDWSLKWNHAGLLLALVWRRSSLEEIDCENWVLYCQYIMSESYRLYVYTYGIRLEKIELISDCTKESSVLQLMVSGA